MAKKEISYKQIGQNVIIVVDGQQYSKKMADRADRTKVFDLVTEFNKKNTITKQKEIISIFTVKEQEVKQKVAKVAKVDKQIKKATNTAKSKKEELKVTDVEKKPKISKEKSKELSKKLASHKKTEIPKENKKTTRRGEY
jgi:recombination DNA repair RAD52 pathway protein